MVGNLFQENYFIRGIVMKGFNCILVIDHKNENILFCKREKPPYQGMLNLVGGKIEDGEESYEAAYRELYEETGISKDNIKLSHFMDMVYYDKDMLLEIFVGRLMNEVILQEEKQELIWIEKTADFFDRKIFAGDGNIGHVVSLLYK